MPALDDILSQKLGLLAAKHVKRALSESLREDGVVVERGGKRLISFSCNDYLGLSYDVRVVAAAEAALEKYGAGAGASRLVTGNMPLYSALEAALAAHKKTEAALVFGSGYLANLGTIPALVGKGDLIIADKFVHACMIDAARLSGAKLLRFAHNNAAHANMLLEANRGEHQHCLILTETIFSMDGDCAPLAELAALAKHYDAWLMTDDAHGLYCHPEPSRGILDPSTSLRFAQDDIIQMGTLSKALGTYGGYVCGSQILIDYLVSAARSLVFSTGLPPASVAASIAALKIIEQEPQRAEKALQNAQYFCEVLGLPAAQSTIVPLVLKENDKALAASALLAERGFLVSAIRPPTVPENTARLRFTFSALHTREQIEQVAVIIREQGWL